jgi:NADP-dependent 3-hydroxy acid dehydrogenase YdfG
VGLGARRTDRIATIAHEIQQADGQALASGPNVTDLESVRAFVGAAHRQFGRDEVRRPAPAWNRDCAGFN